MTDWSIFGGDPAPGAPEAFDAVANALAPIVEVGQSSGDSIRTIAQHAGSAIWSGNAADTFAQSVHIIPNDLAELVTAHQMAIRALTDYAATLKALQQQAVRARARALGAQNAADSASSRLADAQASHSEANQQYLLYRGEVDLLEVARKAADATGDLAASSRLAHEISSSTRARDTAWSNRSVAAADIQTAQSALNSARQQVEDQQGAARGIAAEREGAARALASLLASAADSVVGRRSWTDRVRKDFDSVAGFNWKHAAEGALAGTGRTLMRGAGDIDSFARAHAEGVRNVADIVNGYATDVSYLANSAAPYFTLVALGVDAVSLAVFPPGVGLGNLIGDAPNYVAAEADYVGTGAAGVARGADELAAVPAAQRTAQIEADNKLLGGSAMSLGFDCANIGIGLVLPDSHQVTNELMSGGAVNTVRAASNLEAQNYLIPDVENAIHSRTFGQ